MEKLRAELQSYIGLAKKQHGLERAVEEMLQNPSKGVPREMRVPPPKMKPSADNPCLRNPILKEKFRLKIIYYVKCDKFSYLTLLSVVEMPMANYGSPTEPYEREAASHANRRA